MNGRIKFDPDNGNGERSRINWGAIAYGLILGLVIAFALHYYRASQRVGVRITSNGGTKLDELLQLVDARYVDTIDVEQLEEEILREILKRLDPHSNYIPKKDLQAVHEQLDDSFSGIGVQFNISEDTVMIVRVLSGGPSERVGLRAGDRIVEVDGAAFVGDSVSNEQTMKLLKGPKGTVVELGIVRKGVDEVLKYEITRGDIPLHTVDVSYMMERGVGYVRIDRFGVKTYEEFITALTKLKQEGMSSLILDLRGNGGGYMGAAIRMLEELLNKGDVILFTKGVNARRMEYRAQVQGEFPNLKLAVLIDDWSASASEIVAGAIQDNDRGLILGRRSFGKGLVQQEFAFSDSSAVRLTIARYYIPSGRCIQKPYDDPELYDMDIYNRYLHGEFLQEDSVRVDSLLEYETKGGRKVYGGGGIVPDIFVPEDTSLVSPFFTKSSVHSYYFALSFADRHRSDLEKMTSPEEVLNYLEEKNIMQEFINYVKSKGVKYVRKQYLHSRPLIFNRLSAYVCRNVLSEEAFYKVLEEQDNVIQRAWEELVRE